MAAVKVVIILLCLQLISADFNTDGVQLNLTRLTDDLVFRGSMHNAHGQYSSVNKRPVKRPAPGPDPSSKTQVEWYEESQYYALKASVDVRFRIRHAPVPQAGSPWPMPQLYQTSNTSFLINVASFEFHSIGEPCDIVEYNFRRIRRNTFGENKSTWSRSYLDIDRYIQPELRHLNVTILKECSYYPDLDMDESYDLEIKRTGISVIAREVWGALRGLETFSQLVYQDSSGLFWINKTYIHDYPRFRHRGILLDTSRHYLDKETIISNLEAMAQNKMNVFHWHIVDDQSFPFESKVYPNLTKYGAYNYQTHIYTQEVIAEIIEEARLRGIRVIPEFDTPGHTFSWGYGQDHLLTPCYSSSNEPDGMFGPINPILRKTYSFLRGLFDEVLSVFKDKYVHLGGDEVPFDCWLSNPQLMNFMRRHNMSDIKELLNLYGRELLKLVTNIGSERKQGVGYIVWQEMFDNGVKVKPDTIVQVWSGDTYDLDRVTRAGLRALFSTCWYLDYINYGQDWDKYYRCDQIGQQLEYYNLNQSLLLGGDVCLWTEYADDDSIMPRLWPRASAAAERLWSSQTVTDVHQAAPRIEEQRCRMLRRGLHVGVLSGPGHCRRPKISKSKEEGLIGYFFPVEGNSKQEMEIKMEKNNGRAVYLVDMSTIYIIPLVLVIVICLVVIVTSVQDQHRSRLIMIISQSFASQRRLVLFFLLFVIVWFIWSAPVWMHSWERTHKSWS